MALEGDCKMNTLTVYMDSVSAILARRKLEAGGEVQRYIDSEVIRLCDPYTPYRTGDLRKSVRAGTKIGSGEVIWNARYARFQYYGCVMVSPATGSAWAGKNEKKVLTDRPLTYHGGGGKLWFERMKADHCNEILRGVAQMIGGRIV